jgi:thiosulfate/3-mercaptopyruvate sulfurtransferase
MQSLIHAKELLSLQGTPGLVIIDARAGADVAVRFSETHLSGALHVHLENDLSDIKSDLRQGGRHPLPSPEKFSKLLGKLGIQSDSHVVVYDDKSGAFAATRFWWMLRAAGHKKVQVLDGGMQAAIASAYPVEKGTSKAPQSTPPYPFTQWVLPIASMDKVKEVSGKSGWLVIDVREAERYRGETEPYDPVAGHIPGAVNVPYIVNLDAHGLFHPSKKLNSFYREIMSGRQASKIIVHCGSGVTACHTLLAMVHAGFEIPAMYTGSFSEWCRNENQIVVKDGLLDSGPF